MNDDIPMDIPQVAPKAPVSYAEAVKPRTPAPVAEDPIAKDVTEDADDLPAPEPAPAKKAAPAPKKEETPKAAEPAPADDDIDAQISNILAGMSL